MYRENSAPIGNAGFVTWTSQVYPGLSLEVPKAYHEKAEKLLVAIGEPADFFKKVKSHKKEIDVLDMVSGTLLETIDVGVKAGTDSAKYRTLMEKLYLEVIHKSLFKNNKEEYFSRGREDTYMEITGVIRKIDEELEKLG
ncbi:MAG: hypothetical protein V1813_01085 [Candidatus Aenigmatarchaeota archaeon]